MSAKTVNEEAAQTVSPRHWIRLVAGISPDPADFIHMRRGSRLVAGVAIFHTDPGRCYWWAHVGGTTTSRINSRKTKY